MKKITVTNQVVTALAGALIERTLRFCLLFLVAISLYKGVQQPYPCYEFYGLLQVQNSYSTNFATAVRRKIRIPSRVVGHLSSTVQYDGQAEYSGSSESVLSSRTTINTARNIIICSYRNDFVLHGSVGVPVVL